MKRLIDLLIALAMVIVLFPVFLFTALLIRLNSPGPIFFKQRRIGLNGRIFWMIKFRTMINNAESVGTGLYSFEDDPRVTRVGYYLRRTSIDELPQLFNVLGGSMSLVGPRPPVTYELGPWEEYTPEMRKRFEVKPGITGLAQISGRNDLDWDQKIVYDNRYVDLINEKGLVVDIQILLLTLWIVIKRGNTVEKNLAVSLKDNSIASRAYTATNISSIYPTDKGNLK